jgi:hypothetical protein
MNLGCNHNIHVNGTINVNYDQKIGFGPRGQKQNKSWKKGIQITLVVTFTSWFGLKDIQNVIKTFNQFMDSM